MTMLTFTKMVGSGNDFIVMDNRNGMISENEYAQYATILCDRRHGVGADGVILVAKSDTLPFCMRIINADGSEAEMCGNGARCIARYALEHGIAQRDMCFETRAGEIRATVFNDVVKVNMTAPHDLRRNIALTLQDGTSVTVSHLNTGVPHVVLFVDDVASADVKTIGKAIRYHEAFAPRGTNVNFVQIAGSHALRVRTYERGVEDETLSCGSGSTASALIAAIEKNVQSPVAVSTHGGEILTIYFERGKNDSFCNVFLEGAVRSVFTGELKMNL